MPSSRPTMTLDNAVIPWDTVGIDIKDTYCPVQNHKEKYLVMCDEADSFLRAIRVCCYPPDKSRNVTTEELLQTWDDHWATIFGDPRVLRYDPEGAMNGTKFLMEIASRGVHLDPIAGEAHWQNGKTERAIRTIFETSDDFLAENNGITRREAVARSVAAHVTIERVGGYSPAQWAFGRAPNWGGELFTQEADEVNLARDSSDSFRAGLERQASACGIYHKKLIRHLSTIANNLKNRRLQIFAPGMLVCAWRTGMRQQEKRQGSKRGLKGGMEQGRWYGPGTVLGTQTRRTRRRESPSLPR